MVQPEYSVFGGAAIGGVIFVGLLLMIFRPYWAFLFAIFISLALSIPTLTSTRIQELGPYFELGDACLVVMIMACLWEKKRGLIFPAPALILFAVLTMGFLNSLFHLGLTYAVLRALRWAITFPMMIFLTANLVQDESKVKSLLLLLIAAVITAEVQHLLWVTQGSKLTEDVGLLRTIAFVRPGSDVWLLAGFYNIAGRIPHPWLQTALGALFLTANVTHQTRSIALGFMGGLVGYYLWFLKGPNAFRWQRFKGVLAVFIIGLLLMAMAGFTAFIVGYGERLAQTVERGEDTESRVRGLKIGLNDWLDGNPLIGRGLNYYYKIHKEAILRKEEVAWGDLGYVAYLSQLGLIGFLAYGVWLPLAVILRARRLMQQPQAPPEIVHLAALTGACFIYFPLMNIFSGSFLSVHYLSGILVGGVWGITAFQFRNDKQSTRENLDKESPKTALA